MQLLDSKISGRILKAAREQQQEIDAEEWEDEREQTRAQVRQASHFTSLKGTVTAVDAVIGIVGVCMDEICMPTSHVCTHLASHVCLNRCVMHHKSKSEQSAAQAHTPAGAACHYRLPMLAALVLHWVPTRACTCMHAD